MRPNFSFLSAASNANLKLDGLLKWKKQKQKPHVFPYERPKALAAFKEMMKIIMLRTLLPDVPPLSSPKPRLKHGKQHARLSVP